MSKTCLLCHVVFGTKRRRPTITPEFKRDLYNYIFGLIKKRNCTVVRINGISDHIHILLDLHPSVALADLVKVIKQGSNNWLKSNASFPLFEGWASGYYAASVGLEGKELCRNYIINQEIHHSSLSYINELEILLHDTDLEFREEDWE